MFFSVKDAYDYQGRSYLHAPQDVGVNLKSEFPPEKCFLPKKQIHTWSGHSKGVAAIRWFPQTAHLLLSCSMDCKIKVRRASFTEILNKRLARNLLNGNGFQFIQLCVSGIKKKYYSNADL